jgi:hypothetical protein
MPAEPALVAGLTAVPERAGSRKAARGGFVRIDQIAERGAKD